MIDHKRLVNKIAKEQNISPGEVEEIIASHIDFVKTSIEEQTSSVRVPFLGTFKLNKTALSKYKEKHEPAES